VVENNTSIFRILRHSYKTIKEQFIKAHGVNVEKLTGMTKEQIGVLRNQKNMPFVRLSQRKRLYYADDLAKWFLDNRINIPKSGDEA
jgi:phosphopantetheinyl transferase (holo-ACP synthase)